MGDRPDVESAVHLQLPRADALLFVAASTQPDRPIVCDLSGDVAARVDSDRDRAVLRAFLRLALARLDQDEAMTS